MVLARAIVSLYMLPQIYNYVELRGFFLTKAR